MAQSPKAFLDGLKKIQEELKQNPQQSRGGIASKSYLDKLVYLVENSINPATKEYYNPQEFNTSREILERNFASKVDQEFMDQNPTLWMYAKSINR
ncbi:MAG: hypothetical protein FWG18_04130 [Alphaproteobacteria bacterium]|nr:hypothetical protein [Alphaproteobacteria bacterium]